MALTAEASPGDTLPGSRVGPKADRRGSTAGKHPNRALCGGGGDGFEKARDPFHLGAAMPNPEMFPPFDPETGEVAPRFENVRRIPAVADGDRSEKIDKLVAALARVQAKLKPAPRSSKNPFTGKSYADFASVVGAAQEAGLAEEGIAYHQTFEQDPEHPQVMICATMLALEDQFLVSRIAMKVGSMGGASASQEVVAASSYARRVGFASATGVVAAGEDEDGNEHEQRERPRNQRGQNQQRNEPRGRPPQAAPPNATRGGTWVDTTGKAVEGVRSAVQSRAADPPPARAPLAGHQVPIGQAPPEALVASAAHEMDAELKRHERIVHIMRELQPFGFKLARNATSGRVTLILPAAFVRPREAAHAWLTTAVKFDQLTLEHTEALEKMLKDQLTARAAGGTKTPAPAAPSSDPNAPPTRREQEGRTATEGSRGSRGEPSPRDPRGPEDY